MITIDTQGTVAVIRMEGGENRINNDFVDGFLDALDVVEAREGPVALITTGVDKFFSNGLDLEWMAASDQGSRFIERVHELFARIQNLNAYTVAAVNGHAFAAGAMLATAHDYVVMRSGRGYWCLPEIDLGLALTPKMFALLSAHLPRATLAEATLTGRRYAAEEALKAGIAHEAVPSEALIGRAHEVASAMSVKNRDVLKAHKALLYTSTN
jgi:enoyl-CoA hydratase/carnithine racemase